MDPITCMQSRLTLTPRECTARQEALDREGIPEHPECGECALGQQVRDELEEAAVADALGEEQDAQHDHDVEAAPEASVVEVPPPPLPTAAPAAASHPQEEEPMLKTNETTDGRCSGGCGRKLRKDSIDGRCCYCRGAVSDPKRAVRTCKTCGTHLRRNSLSESCRSCRAAGAPQTRTTQTATMPVKAAPAKRPASAASYPSPVDLVVGLSDADLVTCAQTRRTEYLVAVAELERRIQAKRELEKALAELGQTAA